MKKLLLPGMLGLFAATSQAQDTSFLLKNYKYRTPGFQALTTSFNTSGYAADNRVNGSENKSRYTSANTQVGYSRLRSTDRKWQQLSISFEGSFASNRNNPGTLPPRGEVKDRSGLGSLSWNFSERYHRKNKWYWEFGHLGSVGTLGRREKDSIRTIRSQRPDVSGGLTLGFGRGRIEPVQDAQMALFMLNDLQQQGLLQKQPDAATTLELARLVTDINNRRIFDSRRRRIYELTRLHDFLQQNGLVGQSDIRVFATINDNWALAYNPVRYSGTRWYVQVQPRANWQRDKGSSITGVNVKEVSTSTTSGYELRPVAGVERYVPVSLKWQHNMGAQIAWSRTGVTSRLQYSVPATDMKELRETSEWGTNMFYNLGFYPNNRTIVTSGVALYAGLVHLQEGTNIVRQVREIRPSLNLSADYFISYNTRLSLQAGASYSHMHQERYAPLPSLKYRNVAGSFSFGITHIIF